LRHRKPRKKKRRNADFIVYEKETITADEKRRIVQGKISYGADQILEEASKRIIWRWETHEAELCRLSPVVRSRLVTYERDGVLVSEKRPVVVDYTLTGRVRRRVPYHVMELIFSEVREAVLEWNVRKRKVAWEIKNSPHLSLEEKERLLTLLALAK